MPAFNLLKTHLYVNNVNKRCQKPGKGLSILRQDSATVNEENQ